MEKLVNFIDEDIVTLLEKDLTTCSNILEADSVTIVNCKLPYPLRIIAETVTIGSDEPYELYLEDCEITSLSLIGTKPSKLKMYDCEIEEFLFPSRERVHSVLFFPKKELLRKSLGIVSLDDLTLKELYDIQTNLKLIRR